MQRLRPGRVVGPVEARVACPGTDPHRPVELVQPCRDAASGLSIASEYKCCCHATSQGISGKTVHS